MKFSIQRDKLLKPLQLVNGVVEKRKNLPILSNILLEVTNTHIKLTGSDLEVELCGMTDVSDVEAPGEVTVPARKLFDICKSLSDGSLLNVELEHHKLFIRSGATKFSLATLPAPEFPKVNEAIEGVSFAIRAAELKQLIDRTQFAMAQQDVRYYLNGTLWQIAQGKLVMVATDGHRLSMCEKSIELSEREVNAKVIVPRKAILEIGKMLGTLEDEMINIVVTGNHLRLTSSEFTLISKLIDGRFPDYQAVIPKGEKTVMDIDRDAARAVLSRVAILCNEKIRGVRMNLEENLLKVTANNPEHEEAEERVPVKYESQTSLEIGLNVNYLLDVLNTLPTGMVKFLFTGQDKGVLIEQENDSLHGIGVIMPMRL
jgi:DNA polymerase-3 subunit beta